MATYAIGDIQGCYQQLRQLLKAIDFNDARDTLWLVGDLVNRGPHSREVVQYLMDLAQPPIITLGNHDLHMLAVYLGAVEPSSKDTFYDLLEACDSDVLCRWLGKQKLFHRDSDLGFVMTHAGINPHWDLALAEALAAEVESLISTQDLHLYRTMYGDKPSLWRDDLSGEARYRVIINFFTRMRYCTQDGALALQCKGAPSRAPQALIPWFELKQPWHKKYSLVFGHWAALQGQCQAPKIYALDTGCVWGGRLSALRLEDKRMFSVPGWKKNQIINEVNNESR